ncbi:MAG: hypothetical protein JRF31_08670 [Deltaproteobacteria bacterium]|nr:hypothetical protein [Deltaproteobacteria bacterium]MBW1958658.1 hypothetical protein [Deltaproteobacteria bacterium]MBW2014415.1 hypothetical protein [Deltaproteobacteria bacterium]MBW2089935.1 hypothetical protein [Deltaproteobacteria bacterium]MBW2320898.1 hypothetical protein [Deltaproteobacteria bacterium]
MTCDNRCEIVEWKASNPHLVQEVASPNVTIDGARLLAMATDQIIKENTISTATGCSSGCECIPIGDPERVWSGDRYRKTVITGKSSDGGEWKAEFLFKLNLTKFRYSGECVPIQQHIEPIHVDIEPMP